MNKSPGNKIHRKSHWLLYYIINTDNMYQNLANFVVDTTEWGISPLPSPLPPFVNCKE
jgi:hypothetical protein